MEKRVDKKKLIVVIGMHRSGTSAVTRALQVMGVDLGDNLMPAIVGVNDKGFWEDMDIYQLNEDMLTQISSSWYHFLPISEEQLEKIIQKGYFSIAKRLVFEKIEKYPNFGIKDPRIARLLPFWKQVFSSLGISVSFILTLRNPLSVSRSLYSRDGFPIEQGCLMWADHMVASLVGTMGEDRMMVDYDKLMDKPEITIKSISKKLNLAIDKTRLEEYFNDFLDPKLRHSVFSLSKLKENNSVSQLVYDIYSTLSVLDQDKEQLSKPHITNKICEWNELNFHQRHALKLSNIYMDKFYQSEGLLREKASQLAERDAQLAERDAQLAERNAQLSDIHSSKIWRLGLWLRRARLWLAPAGSIQFRMGRTTLSVIMKVRKKLATEQLNKPNKK